MAEQTIEYKMRYVRSYIHFRKGMDILTIMPPQNALQKALLDRMYNKATTHMNSVGKKFKWT